MAVTVRLTRQSSSLPVRRDIAWARLRLGRVVDEVSRVSDDRDLHCERRDHVHDVDCLRRVHRVWRAW
jgi:hypothetical protein